MMDIEIGSNLFRNTNGSVVIEGVPHFQVAVKPSTGTLLLNVAIFDQTGRMVAKVVDSTLAFNERAAYSLNKADGTVELKEQESGAMVLRLKRSASGRVAIDQGQFWTIKGHQCTITPTECKIDKHTVSKEETDAKGGSVAIGN